MTQDTPQLIIPINKLKIGKHHYSFAIGEEFLSAHEYALAKQGTLQADVELQKQTETLFLAEIDIKGQLELQCHRCLDNYQLPVNLHERMIFKLEGGGSAEEQEGEEMVVLSEDASNIDLTPYIYEFINLAVPLRQLCEQANKECNPAMLAYLEGQNTAKANDNEEPPTDPRWDALRNLSKD